VEIKEEVFEIDPKTQQLSLYFVIVERAQHSLFDLYAFVNDNKKVKGTGIWVNEVKRQENLEEFSIQKFYYYF